jgi:hypothetical protein
MLCTLHVDADKIFTGMRRCIPEGEDVILGSNFLSVDRTFTGQAVLGYLSDMLS